MIGSEGFYSSDGRAWCDARIAGVHPSRNAGCCSGYWPPPGRVNELDMKVRFFSRINRNRAESLGTLSYTNYRGVRTAGDDRNHAVRRRTGSPRIQHVVQRGVANTAYQPSHQPSFYPPTPHPRPSRTPRLRYWPIPAYMHITLTRQGSATFIADDRLLVERALPGVDPAHSRWAH